MMYLLYRIATFLLLFLPRRASYGLASFIARLRFYTAHKDRKTIYRNLLPILGDKRETFRCARKVFEHFAWYLADFLSLSKINSEFISRYVHIEGEHHFDEAVRNKKGVILLSAHIGNYELGATTTSLLKQPIHVVAMPHKYRNVDDFFNRQRALSGIKVIPTGVAVRNCIKILKKGGLVAFLGDRRFSKDAGVPVNICGKKAVLPQGFAFFAAKTGATILPTLFIRKDKYYYRLIFSAPLRMNTSASGNSPASLIERYASVLEENIRSYPEQWYIFEDFWE